MRKILFIIIMSILVLSCSKGTDPKDRSSVTNPSSCILSVDIEGYGDSHIWSRSDCFGIYGSKSGENVRYVVETTSFGNDGQTRIYGTGADGEVIGYYPYDAEGHPAIAQCRQPLADTQTFMETSEGQLKSNSILVAKASDGNLSFKYACGVLRLHMTTDIAGIVYSAELSSQSAALCGDLSMLGEAPLINNPRQKVTIAGIGRACTADTPLDICFMLPPGTYPDLNITLTSDSETIIKPVEATLTVEPKTEVKCTVSNKETVYEGTDIIIIEGKFDE